MENPAPGLAEQLDIPARGYARSPPGRRPLMAWPGESDGLPPIHSGLVSFALFEPEPQGVAGGKGVGVVRAEHPAPVFEQLLQRWDRRGDSTRFAERVGEVVADGEGVGVVRVEHPEADGQQPL